MMEQMDLGMGDMSAEQVIDKAQRENAAAAVLPAGNYNAALTAFSAKWAAEKKDPSKQYQLIKMTFTVQDGPSRGRTINKWIGPRHSNELFSRNSQEFIAKVGVACGADPRQPIKSLAPFLHKTVTLKVKVSKPDAQGRQNNEIDDVIKCTGPSSAPPTSHITAPPPASYTPPPVDGAMSPPPPASGTTQAASRAPWETA